MYWEIFLMNYELLNVIHLTRYDTFTYAVIYKIHLDEFYLHYPQILLRRLYIQPYIRYVLSYNLISIQN